MVSVGFRGKGSCWELFVIVGEGEVSKICWLILVIIGWWNLLKVLNMKGWLLGVVRNCGTEGEVLKSCWKGF